MNPFMLWGGDRTLRCYVSERAPEDQLITTARFDKDSLWTLPSIALVTGKRVEPRIVGVDIFATSATWAMMGAYNLAHAYRPEGVP